MKWSSIAKFLLGSILGIAILISGSLALGYYLMTRLTQTPPKPTFANDLQAATPDSNESTPAVAEATPTPASPLEPGTYRAQVVYPQGLLLRDSSNVDANQIGGVAYQQPVVVLEESADKDWQKIRLESGEEGWVKAGNLERVN